MSPHISAFRVATVFALALLMALPSVAAKSSDQNGNGGNSGHVGCQGDQWGYGLHNGKSGSSNNSSIPIGITLSCLLDILALDTAGNTTIIHIAPPGSGLNYDVISTPFASSTSNLTAFLNFSVQGASVGGLLTTYLVASSDLSITVTSYYLQVKDPDLLNDTADLIHAHLTSIAADTILEAPPGTQIVCSPCTCGLGCGGGGGGGGGCSSGYGCVQGCAFDQDGLLVLDQAVQVSYGTLTQFGTIALQTDSGYNTGPGCFSIPLSHAPLSGYFPCLPIKCPNPGGPYTYQIALDYLNVNPIQNPGWYYQAAKLQYWMSDLYTSVTLGNYVSTSTPYKTYYFDQLDYPDTPYAAMGIVTSNSISSTMSYSIAGNGGNFGVSAQWSSSWTSGCAVGTCNILSELDQLFTVGGVETFANAPSKVRNAWSTVYGYGLPNSNGPRVAQDIAHTDYYTLQSAENLAGMGGNMTLIGGQPISLYPTQSRHNNYTASSSVGTETGLQFSLSFGGKVSLGLDFSDESTFQGGQSVQVSIGMWNPGSNTGCYSFYVFQEGTPFPSLGGIIYFPGPLHVWATPSC